MRKLYLLALGFLLPAIGYAQIYWDFSTATPLSGIPANVTVSAVIQGNNNGTTTLLTTTSASSGYTGASGGNNAGAAAFIGAFDTTVSTYFQWTITPDPGVSLTVTQVNFGARSTGTGPKNYDVRTSLDGFATPAATAAVAANSVWALNNNTVSLTTAPGQAVTFRIYGYNGAGNPSASTANWRIDDLTLIVSTSGSGGGTAPTAAVAVTPTSLSGFSTTAGTASASQSATVTGSNLTAGITVTASAGFEVSADNTTFADSVVIPRNGDTVTPSTVFARIGAASPSGVASGSLTVSSAGATSQTVTLNGTVTGAAAPVVINQIYGGGGNSGSLFSNDYIELFNNADTAVSLSGWSVQYASATGTSSWLVTPLSGTVPAHGFYLIQEAAGATPSNPLPTPDVSGGAINMSAASGKVILSNSTVALSGANPPDGGNVIDKVGYGTANGLETAPAPGLTNTTAVARVTAGVDNNNNSTDFQVISPLPRNSGYTTTPPVAQTLIPANGSANIPSSLIPILIFSKPVVKAGGTIVLVTDGSDGTPVSVSDPRIVLSNDSVTLNLPLAGGHSYAIRITAGAFQDAFGNNFAGLTTNTAWAFTTFNNTIAPSLPFVTGFDNCTGSGLLPNGFTAFSVTGAQVWDCTTFGRDTTMPAGTAPSGHAIEINGFANGINNVNQDWLITPRFDLSNTIFPLLSFWSRNAFQGAPLVLKISTDYTGSGDPTRAHWTDLNGKFPSVASDVWTPSANLDLSALKQSNVYIAFVYTSSTQDGSRWTVDDFSLINSPTPPPPSLTLSTNDLEFGFTPEHTHAVQKLTIIGADLTSPVAIRAEGNFEVSTDSIHYSDSVSLQGDSTGSVTDPIFVRFTPTIANAQFIDSVLVTISDSVAVVNVKGNSIDPASVLNIVDWNLNWFGTPDSTLGPTDKTLQEKNVGQILPGLHADLYALEEVVNQPALDSIVAKMPGYAYVVGQFGSFSNPTISDPDPLNTVQKLAFVYNTAKISVVRTDSLLTLGVANAADPSTTYYNDWSSGRFPYMLTANVSLAGPNGTTNTKTVRFINVHAKANTSPILTAYDRRADGAQALDSLLKAQFPNDYVVILGDFNDDLNQTITSGINPPVTSWSAFTMTDSTLYQFPTKPLSPTGQHSDVNFTSVIDNVILNDSMAQFYLPNSATVLSNVANLVTNYGTTTTDHYPVFTQYSFTPPVVPPAPSLNLTALKKGNAAILNWKTTGINTTTLFAVEKSLDDKLFVPIGLVEAIPNDDSVGTYTFTDPLPLPGTDYYRLRLIDGSRLAGFSDTVSLAFTPPLTIALLPNPAIGFTELIVTHADAAYTVQVLDVNGRIVKQLTGLPSTPLLTIGLAGLRGVYTVQVVTPTQIASQKLVVL